MAARRTNRKQTEQELKDKLWEMVQTLDFSSNSLEELSSHPDYHEWDDVMTNRPVKTVKVGGFEAALTDIDKILEEVEGSCLTERCKKTLTDALRKAK